MSWADIAQLVRLPLLGAVAFVGVQQLWLARARPHDPTHLVAGLLSAAAALFLFARYLPLSDHGADLQLLGVQLELAGALLLATLGAGLLRAVTLDPPRIAVHRWLLAAALPLPLLWVDGLLIHHEVTLRADAFGALIPVPQYALGALLFIPYLAVLAAQCVRAISSSGGVSDPLHRPLAYIAAVVIFPAAINDILLGTGTITSIRITDVGMALLALGLSYEIARRTSQLMEGMEESIRARTTEVRLQQIELARALEDIQQLVDAVPDTVFVYRAGRIVFVNRAGRQLLGLTHEELCNRNIEELFPPESREEAVAHFDLIESAVRPTTPRETKLVRKDGKTVLGEVVGLECEYAGGPAAIALIRDVTERRQLQEQILAADRLSSLGVLAAGIAHEINNPLNFLMGNLEIASSEISSSNAELDAEALEEVRSMLAAARVGADRVRRIVRDMQAFAKPNASPTKICDVERAMQLAVNLVRHQLEDTTELKIECESLPKILGAEGRLVQVFVNLLVNAVQAASDEADKHSVKVTGFTDEQGRPIVMVSDTGKGMTEDDLARALEPFFTTKPVGVGTGLGLSVSHGIVRSLGGEMQIESEVGHGTTVKLVFNPAPDIGEQAAPDRAVGA